MTVRFVDEFEHGFGWIDDTPLGRASHALVDEGRVWLVDPVEGAGVEERVRGLGEPAGVLQLLDRHNRAAAEWARRLAVPLHIVPADLAGVPFRFPRVARSRFWKEVALWWPEQRVLVTADALGTIPHYFALAGERVGVHPLLRLKPPRTLRGLDPAHLLVGHGEGVHGESAAQAVADALAHSRRRFFRLPLELPKLRRR